MFCKKVSDDFDVDSMIETLTSKGMDMNERLHVSFMVGWMPSR